MKISLVAVVRRKLPVSLFVESDMNKELVKGLRSRYEREGMDPFHPERRTLNLEHHILMMKTAVVAANTGRICVTVLDLLVF